LTVSTSHLIAPHGGELINLIAEPPRVADLKAHSKQWPSWDLTARQLCDLELLITGGFSPLEGFMTQADYDSVCQNMRLVSGVLWPMPITLDVTEEFVKQLNKSKEPLHPKPIAFRKEMKYRNCSPQPGPICRRR